MAIGLELCEQFVEQNHFTRVHDKSSCGLVLGLVLVFGALEKVRVVTENQQ